MPKSKYDIIYRELKDKIINNEYPEGDYLPPENTLVQIYDCSRNTIRRAISHLVMEGYVQPHHGKGVRVIFSSEIHNHKYDFMSAFHSCQIRIFHKDKGNYFYRYGD